MLPGNLHAFWKRVDSGSAPVTPTSLSPAPHLPPHPFLPPSRSTAAWLGSARCCHLEVDGQHDFKPNLSGAGLLQLQFSVFHSEKIGFRAEDGNSWELPVKIQERRTEQNRIRERTPVCALLSISETRTVGALNRCGASKHRLPPQEAAPTCTLVFDVCPLARLSCAVHLRGRVHTCTFALCR